MNLPTLTDQFQNSTASINNLAARLQEILDGLPAQLAVLRQNKDQDRLLTIIPITSEDRSGNVSDVLFAFKKKLAATHPDVEDMSSSFISMYGDFITLTLVTNTENSLKTAETLGPCEHHLKYVMQLMSVLGSNGYAELAHARTDAEMVGFSHLVALAHDIDPASRAAETLSSLEIKTLYWNVNPAWPHPHELPPKSPKIFNKPEM